MRATDTERTAGKRANLTRDPMRMPTAGGSQLMNTSGLGGRAAGGAPASPAPAPNPTVPPPAPTTAQGVQQVGKTVQPGVQPISPQAPGHFYMPGNGPVTGQVPPATSVRPSPTVPQPAQPTQVGAFKAGNRRLFQTFGKSSGWGAVETPGDIFSKTTAEDWQRVPGAVGGYANRRGRSFLSSFLPAAGAGGGAVGGLLLGGLLGKVNPGLGMLGKFLGALGGGGLGYGLGNFMKPTVPKRPIFSRLSKLSAVSEDFGTLDPGGIAMAPDGLPWDQQERARYLVEQASQPAPRVPEPDMPAPTPSRPVPSRREMFAPPTLDHLLPAQEEAIRRQGASVMQNYDTGVMNPDTVDVSPDDAQFMMMTGMEPSPAPSATPAKPTLQGFADLATPDPAEQAPAPAAEPAPTPDGPAGPAAPLPYDASGRLISTDPDKRWDVNGKMVPTSEVPENYWATQDMSEMPTYSASDPSYNTKPQDLAPVNRNYHMIRRRENIRPRLVEYTNNRIAKLQERLQSAPTPRIRNMIQQEIDDVAGRVRWNDYETKDLGRRGLFTAEDYARQGFSPDAVNRWQGGHGGMRNGLTENTRDWHQMQSENTRRMETGRPAVANPYTASFNPPRVDEQPPAPTPAPPSQPQSQAPQLAAAQPKAPSGPAPAPAAQPSMAPSRPQRPEGFGKLGEFEARLEKLSAFAAGFFRGCVARGMTEQQIRNALEKAANDSLFSSEFEILGDDREALVKEAAGWGSMVNAAKGLVKNIPGMSGLGKAWKSPLMQPIRGAAAGQFVGYGADEIASLLGYDNTNFSNYGAMLGGLSRLPIGRAGNPLIHWGRQMKSPALRRAGNAMRNMFQSKPVFGPRIGTPARIARSLPWLGMGATFVNSSVVPMRINEQLNAAAQQNGFETAEDMAAAIAKMRDSPLVRAALSLSNFGGNMGKFLGGLPEAFGRAFSSGDSNVPVDQGQFVGSDAANSVSPSFYSQGPADAPAKIPLMTGEDANRMVQQAVEPEPPWMRSRNELGAAAG